MPALPDGRRSSRRTRLAASFVCLLSWTSLDLAAQEVKGPAPMAGTLVAQQKRVDDLDLTAPPRGILPEISKHGLPPVPVGTAGAPQPVDPPSASREVVTTAPGAFTYFINRPSKPSGASTSYVTEPAGALNRDTVLQTGNWYASLSKDSGMSWEHISPYTNFPAVDAGFCCDQKALYVPSRDITVWVLEYGYSSTTLAGTHRIAFTTGRDGLRKNTGWTWYDVTGQFFGLGTGLWLDFPDVSYSDTHIYFSANIYSGATGAYVTSVLYRAELTDFANGGPTSFQSFTRTTIGGFSYRFTQGPEPIMYAAAHVSTTLLRVYWWTTLGSISWRDQSVPAWSAATMVAPNPDARGWAGFPSANDRVLGGYASPTEFGFLWASAPVAERPQPFTRVARFRVTNMTLIRTEDIWSATDAFIYPAACTNSLGHIGVTLAHGNATTFPRTVGGIVDTYEPNFAAKAWVPAAIGTSGPATNRWGDWFTVARHPVLDRTFVATGTTQSGGALDANASPCHMWFGRDDYTPVWVNLNVTSVPVSGIGIFIAETDRNGAKEGVTPFVRSFAPRQGYTLTAPASYVAGQATYLFHVWAVLGVPQTVNERVLEVADIGTAGDDVEARYRIRRTLTIGSVNPAAGVPITVGVTDANGNKNGTTAFTRFYKNLTQVPLTAPATAGINPFKRWTLNGVDQPLAQRTVTADMMGNVTANAVYFVRTPGSFTPFGTGCAGSNGPDVQTASGIPDFGKMAHYALAGGHASSVAILTIGFSKTIWGTIPLPFSLEPLAPGCTLYSEALVLLPTPVNAAGIASVDVSIPNDANLLGVVYFTQFWCLDLPANALGFTFSNAIETSIGGDV